MDPGPHTIIAAGQIQARGLGSIIMIRYQRILSCIEVMVYSDKFAASSFKADARTRIMLGHMRR